VRERLDLAPPQAQRANGLTLPQQRNRHYGPGRRLSRGETVFRIAPYIVDVRYLAVQDRPAHGDLPCRRLWKPAAGLLDLRLGHAVVGIERDHLAIEPVQSGERRLAQPSGASDDSIEDRLQVSRRAGNDAKDLACSGLLLECLVEVAVASLQLLEQPDVLDGDN